jgi:hypothetical protein
LNALKGYETALSQLQPVLDSVAAHVQNLSNNRDGDSLLPAAVLNALWKKAYPDNSATLAPNTQYRQLPTQPATSLEALIATFHENFENKMKIEILDSSQVKHLIATFKGVFIAHILVDTMDLEGETSSILNSVPIDIDIKTAAVPLRATGIAASPPLFIQQLKTAATLAVLEMKDKVKEETAPLERLVLWLALCAVRIEIPEHTWIMNFFLFLCSTVNLKNIYLLYAGSN